MISSEEKWEFNEVIVASNAKQVLVYEPKTPKTLKTYHISNVAPNCLALLGEDYFIGALSNASNIKIWPVRDEKNSPDRNNRCGLVSALTVSNCGTYCVAAFKKEIRIWNVQSGQMLNAFTKHYQDITILKFTSDDAILLSGSKDGCVKAWIFSKMTYGRSNNFESVQPLHSWNNHTKEITDIFVGSHGVYSRMASSSLDMTCRIYEINSGLLLTTVCLDVPVTSVAMDSLEYYLILGTYKGTICKINLYDEQPRELHYSSMEKSEVSAHEKAVITLSMYIMGDKFLSISSDNTLKIWDLASMTCMTKFSDGPYHNAFFTLYPTPLLTKQEPYFLVKELEGTLNSPGDQSSRTGSIQFKTRDTKLTMSQAVNFDQNYHPAILNGNSDLIPSEITAAETKDQKAENKFQEIYRGESMDEVRELNAQLYSYMVSTVFKNIDA